MPLRRLQRPLFLPGPLNKVTSNDLAFPIVIAAVVAAPDKHGNLLRMSITSPGNDFNHGAMEAPPAIVSTYFGEDLTAYLKAFRNGKDAVHVPGKNMLSISVKDIVAIKVLPPRTATTRPAQSRTRTPPPASCSHRCRPPQRPAPRRRSTRARPSASLCHRLGRDGR